MLVAHNVSKRYGKLWALRDVSATFRAGEIHAVLGENGAGKSTLMGVLSGFVSPSEGRVTLDGAIVPTGKPFACKQLGIEMVHQHFTLVSAFTVAENFALARMDKSLTRLDVNKLAEPAVKIAARLGWQIDPSIGVQNLAVGAQQRVEILKSLAGNARVLVFDEPTAVLAPDEVLDLFRVLRQLKEEGRIVILIAHKLREVMAVADRVTVLRKGIFVASAEIGHVDAEQLATWMVGDMPISPDRHDQRETVGQGLSVRNLSVFGDRGDIAVNQVSFDVNQGEILGIGGVDGNGQIELAEALVGVRVGSQGETLWRGKPFASNLGIGYVPQDRQMDGLATSLSIQDNALISGYKKVQLRNGPFLRIKRIKKWCEGLIQRFAIQAPGPATLVSSLSGGNQQKVVVSRILDEVPSLLVVMSPTRGLDIKATEFVHERIREAKSSGCAVIVISTDLDELAELADRTLFMSSGRLTEASDALSLVGGTA